MAYGVQEIRRFRSVKISAFDFGSVECGPVESGPKEIGLSEIGRVGRPFLLHERTDEQITDAGGIA
jgi:hypothetical protein